MIDDTIYYEIKNMLGDEYTIINSYDGTADIDLSGVIAINITDRENLFHGMEKDYKFNVVISGQTLAEEDKDKNIIQEMLNYVMITLDTDILRDNIQNCAGIIMSGSSLESDGDTNNFQIQLELYCCNCY